MESTDEVAGEDSLLSLTDQTRAEMREIIARYAKPRSALLPMLHLAQSVAGFVSRGGIAMCAE